MVPALRERDLPSMVTARRVIITFGNGGNRTTGCHEGSFRR
jgi:hypothetical protein